MRPKVRFFVVLAVDHDTLHTAHSEAAEYAFIANFLIHHNFVLFLVLHGWYFAPQETDTHPYFEALLNFGYQVFRALHQS